MREKSRFALYSASGAVEAARLRAGLVALVEAFDLRLEAAVRVFAITVAYAAVIGAFNLLTGSNYMYLAAPPENPSLLSLLGPWPWYLLTAACVAIVLFAVLDAPFRRSRRRVLQDAPVGRR